jgi:hypothetical protein
MLIEKAPTRTYEAPAIEDRAPIEAPLKTVAQTERISPKWRRPESD